MNRFTIAGMQPDERLSRTLPSISRFSITGNESRPDWVFCLLQPVSDGSMKKQIHR